MATAYQNIMLIKFFDLILGALIDVEAIEEPVVKIPLN